MTTTHNVSDAIADVAAARSEVVFGIMGNGNAFFVSSITARGFPYVDARHETGAVVMAEAYYLSSQRLAVATTTYGPGFTNALTALTDASKVNAPLVLVTGAGPTTGLREWDVDQAALAATCGVPTVTARRESVYEDAGRAFDLAIELCKPVVLEIPYDISASPVPFQDVSSGQDIPARVVPRADRTVHSPTPTITNLAEVLSAAERPLILTGRGAAWSGAGDAVRELGDRVGALFATSVLACNLLDSEFDLGVCGGFSPVPIADVIREADVVVAFGASLSMPQLRYGSLFGGTAFFQVEVQSQPTSDQVTSFIQGDARTVAESLLDLVPQQPTAAWRETYTPQRIQELRTPPALPSHGEDGRLMPQAAMSALRTALPPETTIVQDTGHFYGWAPMYLPLRDPQALVVPGFKFQSIGLGMGSAVGAAHARPDRLPVLISGDGGALMALPEFETLLRRVERGIVVILNDAAYGMEVHQYRGLDHSGIVFDEFDYAALAMALGAAEAHRIDAPDDFARLEDWLAAGSEGVIVLDVRISRVASPWLEESLPLLSSGNGAAYQHVDM